MVMQFRSCCCCASLRTGTIIIAVLGLISGVSFIVEGISQTDSAGSGNSTVIQPTLLPELTRAGLLGNVTATNGTTTDGDVPGEHGFRVTQTIYGFLETIICALLLVGAIRNSAKLIYPWIFVSVILCVLGVIIFLGIGILIIVGADLMALGLTYIIFGLIATALHVYFILVVNSFHSTLKSGQVSRA